MKPFGNKYFKHRWIFKNPTNRSRENNINADRVFKKTTRQEQQELNQELVQEYYEDTASGL